MKVDAPSVRSTAEINHNDRAHDPLTCGIDADLDCPACLAAREEQDRELSPAASGKLYGIGDAFEGAPHEWHRLAELEILESIPGPIGADDEARLLAGDPALGPALNKLVCAAGPCNSIRLSSGLSGEQAVTNPLLPCLRHPRR
jgi:hypothetical protein